MNGERGVATVLAAAWATVLMGLAMVLVQVAMIVAVKHRVASAADLAALAGSGAAVHGDDACAVARAVARRNDARLEACRVDLAVVTVRVRGVPRRVVGVPWVSTAHARAAPAYYVAPVRGSIGRNLPEQPTDSGVRHHGTQRFDARRGSVLDRRGGR